MKPVDQKLRQRRLLENLMHAVIDQPDRALPCARSYARGQGVRSPVGEMEGLMALTLAEVAEILQGQGEES